MHPPRKPTSAAEFEQVLQHVQIIVDNEQQRGELLEANGDNAQEWLDLFQLLAEYPNNTTILRSWIFKLMIRLSRRSGLLPQCLTIRDVKKLGDYPVGGGSFGDVWKGKVGQQIVCLKVIRAFETSDVQLISKDYMQEAIIWRQLNHPNLLPFMGIYYLDTEQRQLCLVSPWMEKGNLVQFLRNTSCDLVDHDSLAYDVAHGLSYLHAKDIVHGDLKGVNILITPDLRACIGDFGLSRVSATQLLLSETSRSKGTTRWLAPELLRPTPRCMPSKQSDIYAYACVCYEIFTGQIPFHELAEAAIVLAVVLGRQRPSRPEDCAALRDWMWDMMVQCWNEIPFSRPNMAAILTYMHEKNGDHRLALASEWNDPTFTQIWNDAQYPPVVQAVEAARPLTGDSAFYSLLHGQSQLLVTSNLTHDLVTPPSVIQSSHGLVGVDTEEIGEGGHDFGRGSDTAKPGISTQENHVTYFFENIQGLNWMLANHTVMNTTSELIVQNPTASLMNAVRAIANLHYTRSRIAQGLEAPETNPEHSAIYFYDQALLQLANAKQLKGVYTTTEVFATFHLIWYRQLSGKFTHWEGMLQLAAFDWIAQLGLLHDDNPRLALDRMSETEQLSLKLTMVIDIMSSLTLMRPPKYFSLYQRLLGSEENLLRTGGMQLESLSGCPDEAWLAIVEVSVLAFWKVTEERKGSLSVRELVRRGDDIERRLRSTAIRSRESFQTERPLSQNLSLEDVKVTSSVHQLVTALFRETALLYLHSMTSPSLGAYEITTSVDIIVELLRQIPSGIDRTLVFPICLVGCMTDDPNHRAFLKWRLQAQDETIGNILNVKFLIEQIWQRRRDSTAHVDWRELLSPRSLNLLLI